MCVRLSDSLTAVCPCWGPSGCWGCWSWWGSCQLWGDSWWSSWRPWTTWPRSACCSCSSSSSSGKVKHTVLHMCCIRISMSADHKFFNSVCFCFLSFYVGCWFFRETTKRKRDHCFILFIYLCLYGLTFFFFQGVHTCLTAATEAQEGHRVPSQPLTLGAK